MVVARVSMPLGVAQVSIVAPHVGENLRLAFPLHRIGNVAGVQRLQLLARRQRQLGELLLAFRITWIGWRQMVVGVPLAQTLALHEGREGLVEGGVAPDVKLLVREFMEDHADHLVVAPAIHGAEQRIGEVPQRGIRRYAADPDVVALLLQLFGQGLGAIVVIKTLVGDATGEQEAALHRLQ